MRLFADYAWLSYQHSDLEYLNEVINNELVKVDEWLCANTLQSPLTSLRTYDVTHSCFVTHFRILKIQKIKFFIFLLLHKLGLLYIFFF